MVLEAHACFKMPLAYVGLVWYLLHVTGIQFKGRSKVCGSKLNLFNGNIDKSVRNGKNINDRNCSLLVTPLGDIYNSRVKP